ncbi:RNA polymerase II subunit A C-terminal domain phosphatase [Entomophthora muscae]|uniref:RNA polymerase II subunit A C-terminal domain phosphatase n=1 Tax=Entomophthora muscae TaxID=34485 RepID=A0ACC2SNF3_9FUNG|nr:RNA polymerase II subunit A C-terminal domain phosphatase [Entomophthora muscae]
MVKFSIVCSSNQNRSMAAHALFKQRGLSVSSYGTGSKVRLPGPSIHQPKVYDFGIPYDTMYQELKATNQRLYTDNGVLELLERNRSVKLAPERFQDAKERHEIIITCEERCFDAVCEDIILKNGSANLAVHIINIEIMDTIEDSAEGSKLILNLALKIQNLSDLSSEIEPLLERFQSFGMRKILHTVALT